MIEKLKKRINILFYYIQHLLRLTFARHDNVTDCKKRKNKLRLSSDFL